MRERASIFNQLEAGHEIRFRKFRFLLLHKVHTQTLCVSPQRSVREEWKTYFNAREMKKK